MKKIRFLIFFLIGLFIFQWVFNFFSGEESVKLILDNKFQLILLIIAHIPTLYFDSYAWLVLMTKNKLSNSSAFLITWISQTSGKIFPTGNITGELVRVYLAKTSGQTFSYASTTVLVDLFIAAISLLIFGILSLLLILFKDSNLILNNGFTYFIVSIFLIFLATTLFIVIIRNRLLYVLLKKFSFQKILRFNRSKIMSILRLDYSLYKLSQNNRVLFHSLVLRLLGWLAGAFEIYVFLLIIDVDANFVDVIIIESITAIVRSIVFFIPAGLGVQELAFVMIGEILGFSYITSFSIALGRRLREIMVGIPAILYWYLVFRKKVY